MYFIEPYHPDKYFWRGQYYGENDDFKRFSFFSRAALELLLQAGKKPDIIHCHDWQTAFVVCVQQRHVLQLMYMIIFLTELLLCYRHHCIGIFMHRRD